MAWETREWTTTPSPDVMKATSGGRLLRRRARVLVDPRSFDADDLNDLNFEATVMAVSSNGPMIFFEDDAPPMFRRLPLIDILMIEPVAS